MNDVRHPGLDPAWSRSVTALDSRGVHRTWHILDTGAAPGQQGTLLCVHGNPTWSYLWRHVLARFAGPGSGWRVVAVDHLDMGRSERTGTVRRLEQRITDLSTLTEAIGLTGPVVTVGHDWGGIISLGWALRHRPQLRGVVLTNTAVHQPADSAAPGLLRLARLPGVLPTVTVRTTTFLQCTLALANPRLPREVRAAYLAPYRTAERRAAIGGFVEDIPMHPGHPSWTALNLVANHLDTLADVPTLLLWGPRDPVFGAAHLRDLRARLPHADYHRFEGAGHLLAEDADVAGAIAQWLPRLGRPARRPEPAAATEGHRDLWAALRERADDRSAALVELAGARRTVSWSLLWGRIEQIARGLAAEGVGKGDRVALLVPPGADLTAALYACLRIGAVVVLADPGLGVRGMRRALMSADPRYLIAVDRGLAAAAVLRFPGRRFGAGPGAAALGARTLGALARLGAHSDAVIEPPGPDDDAAVLFTSGSTGPAKGAVYTHRKLAAVRDALAGFGLGPDTPLVAAFAPFALFGPALGAVSAVPDMNVTAPRTLTARALADAVHAIDATAVFASPAALRNVADTAERHPLPPLDGVTLLLSAGAPVPAALLRRVRTLMPKAQPHTPYGMTEALPVTDITLDEIDEAGAGEGICVGLPLPGVRVSVDRDTGEIMVSGDHVKDRYDALWLTEDAGSRDVGWHRTGDVGHLDARGRLWVEGRLGHVIHTAEGRLTPVGIEQRAETVAGVARAAAVGVGPRGTQQLVVVAETGTDGLATPALADEIRAATGRPVAAVLTVRSLPTDIRHNSKIDRTRLAAWAERKLSGGRP